MSKEILIYLGEKNLTQAESINDALLTVPNGEQILELVSQKQMIMKDAWLTSTGHQRPGMKTGLPMREAKKQARKIQKKINSLP